MIRHDRIIAKAPYLIPPEYMPVPRAAIKNRVPSAAIHRLIHARAIPYLKIGSLYFIREDLVILPTFREYDDRVYWKIKTKTAE